MVSRVRQFLSTPHYVESQDSLNCLHTSPSKHGRVSKSQIPVYQYLQQSNPILLSPNSRSNFNPNFSPNHSGGGGGDEERLLHHNQSNTAAHISFSDDLFINHSHHQQSSLGTGLQEANYPSSPKYNPGQQFPGAPIQYQQNQGKAVDISYTDQIHGKNGRKNFETFVMTGDAILNLTRNDSNDSYKPSPTKTASKLTPMPQMPVFVEREKDYKRRLQLERQMEKEKELKEEEKSDPVTPPLPPPPVPEDIKENSHSSNNNSVSNKSDNLPPPPPDVGENASVSVKSQSVKNGHVGGNGCNNYVIENINKSPKMNSGSDHANRETVHIRSNHQSPNNNNEDTSISSSVMSDSGDEMIGDEEAKNGTLANDEGGAADGNRVVLKIESRNISSACSAGTEKERDAEFAEVIPEKSHFPERER